MPCSAACDVKKSVVNRLPDGAAVHVGEGQHDGVDRPVGDGGVDELTSWSGHAPC